MEKITIKEIADRGDGWILEVRVGEDNGGTVHRVTVPLSYWEDLSDSRFNHIELTLKSFEFLLEREPKESILKEFELPTIQKYFPEYERSMKKLWDELI